ncbi:MAG: TetR/AcrR family transcriptional regulator [Phenylobacterium sp.]
MSPSANTPGDTRPPAADDLRHRILDAAFGAFIELGYAGTSTLEIATRAKVSKRDLYAHFGSKQALFNAGIAERTERMRVAMEVPAVASRGDLAEALALYGRTILSEVTHPHVLAVHRMAIAEAARSPELAAFLDLQGRGANVATLMSLLEHARALGLIGGADTAEMAGQFGGLMWRDSFTRLLLGVVPPPTPEEIARRVDRAVASFLKLFALEPAG